VSEANEAETPAESLDDGDVRDELPEDLNASDFVGPYMFPNNNRRRIPGVLYIVIGIIFVLLYLLVNDSPMVNAGWAWGGGALLVIGIYNLIAGWSLKIDENDALVQATRTVGFPVGHASAQLGWRGWLSRPTWRILLYSNEPQPDKRGLVLIDGNDGEVLDTIVENNPEDWSQYV
jgi:hypothetical protein|tara:strand:+ start:409 stop:936 length:528 start_codon:yes stop_codon:yes gene_type:complete